MPTMTATILESGAARIGRTGTKLHFALKIERAYQLGTGHPLAGKKVVVIEVRCDCGCKGRQRANVYFLPNALANCGTART